MLPTRGLFASCVATFLMSFTLGACPTQAQTVIYGGVSIGGYAPTPYYGGYVPRSNYTPSYGGYHGGYANPYGRYAATPGVYGQAYAPAVPYSPAQRQGYAEGRLYYETGVIPNHCLSPAETQGFLAGESRQARQPWQVDPARQQGYREGLYYWETGLRPNRPLSPAEQQGFLSGERRAANGFARPW